MPKYLLFILFLILISCKDDENKQIIAKVGDEYLYSSDLSQIIPQGTHPADSTEMVKNYIDNWILKKLVLEQATRNLSKEQMDFDKQLDDYKTSLIIYAYERELVRQKLDTNVNMDEIKAYYEENIQDFFLKDNIVKVNYVKIELGSSLSSQIRELLRSGAEDDLVELEALCTQYASNYYIDNNSWLLFNDLLKEIPLQTYNQEQTLRYNSFIETTDSLYHYFLKINDYKIKESASPLSFEVENIRNIIINKRKMVLIEAMQKEVFDDAVRNERFKIYVD